MVHVDIEKLGGGGALAVVVCGILAAILMAVAGGAPPAAESIETWLGDVAGQQGLRILGLWFFVLAALLIILLALGLSQLLREQGTIVWLAFTTVVIGGIVSAGAGMGEIALADLADAYASGTAEVQANLAALGASLALGERWVMSFGSLLVGGVGVPLFSVGLLRDPGFPQWFGWLGLGVGALAWIGALRPLGVVFLVLFYIALVAFAVWGAVLGAYLIRPETFSPRAGDTEPGTEGPGGT